jgi:hypothetical protein
MSDKEIEPDWKQLKAVYPLAVERFSERILSEVQAIMGKTDLSAQDRYRETHNLIRERDKEMAHLFDRYSRSHVFRQLLGIRAAKLITEEEWARFSGRIRESIDGLLEEYTDGQD